MDTRLAKYPATPAGVKRGLKRAKLTQARAASETFQSPALVSLVLNKKVVSQPCLNKLADLIARTLAEKERVA